MKITSTKSGLSGLSQKFLSFLISALILSGCNAPDSPGKGENEHKKLKFIFITCVVNEDFFIPVKKGMEDAARIMDVECTFTGTEGVDIEEQAGMVRQAIKDGYDGIALNIIDPEGFDDVAREAADAGIPLVAFNVDDHATPNARLSTVSQKLYEAGKQLGREAAKFIPDGSEILMTMHDEGVSALDDRLQGAQDGIREAGLVDVKWKVVISGNIAEEAAKVITKVLQNNPKIKHVLCTGQADTEGVGLAIAENFAEKGYKAAGFDLSKNILENILQGHIAFTIDQQPYMQGFFPVIQLALYKRYGIIPSNIDAGAAIIDINNAESVLQLTEQHYR